MLLRYERPGNKGSASQSSAASKHVVSVQNCWVRCYFIPHLLELRQYLNSLLLFPSILSYSILVVISFFPAGAQTQTTYIFRCKFEVGLRLIFDLSPPRASPRTLSLRKFWAHHMLTHSCPSSRSWATPLRKVVIPVPIMNSYPEFPRLSPPAARRNSFDFPRAPQPLTTATFA